MSLKSMIYQLKMFKKLMTAMIKVPLADLRACAIISSAGPALQLELLLSAFAATRQSCKHTEQIAYSVERDGCEHLRHGPVASKIW